MRTRAFIFDMDGVMVNSEPTWERYETIFLPKLLGQQVYQAIKSQILGNTVDAIYQLAIKSGVTITKDRYINTYDQYAQKVYTESEITPNIDSLIDQLVEKGFQVGLVSASRQNWIDIVLSRLKNSSQFSYIASTNDLKMPPKPSPVGYLTAIQALGATPKTSVIIEDTKKGVQAAKASGAYTICFTKYLPKNYLPTGANKYIDDLKDVFPL